jgi:hypothetical protein
MTAGNGTRLGEWLLDTSNNQFGPVADFDKDGRDEILVRSPWGIGVLKYHHGALTAVGVVANGTEWALGPLNALADTFLPIRTVSVNYGLFYRSSDGIAVINLMTDGSWNLDGLSYLWGMNIDSWTVGQDDNFGPVADYDNDGACEILVTSSWGIGVMRFGVLWQTVIMVRNGTSLPGGWTIDTTNNNFFLVGRSQLLVTSPWGIGGLLVEQGLPEPGDWAGSAKITTMWLAKNGADLGGWILDTFTDRLGPTAAYINPGTPQPPNDYGQEWLPDRQVLVQSLWGIGLLVLGPEGYPLTAIAMTQIGSNIGNWTLDSNDNFVATGKFSGGTQDELLVTNPSWGIGFLKLPSSYDAFPNDVQSPAPTTLICPLLQPNGTRFGAWLLDTDNNKF